MKIFDAAATAAALPWDRLVDAVADVLFAQRSAQVQAPERLVLPITDEARWFLMPAFLAPAAGGIAAVKLITYHPSNPARGHPAIQGDVIVMRTDDGERLALLDGPAVTVRRTAAVSALAARALAAEPGGPMLVFGAGPQAVGHVEAFRSLFGTREVWVRSGSDASAQRLAAHARSLGCEARVADDLDAALRACTVVVTATPARTICLDRLGRPDVFIAAVGAFTPGMAEVHADVVRRLAAGGAVVLDSADARHEAGDVLQAGVDPAPLLTLGDVLAAGPSGMARRPGPTMFKSCGSALWDLAAARCVAASYATSLVLGMAAPPPGP